MLVLHARCLRLKVRSCLEQSTSSVTIVIENVRLLEKSWVNAYFLAECFAQHFAGDYAWSENHRGIFCHIDYRRFDSRLALAACDYRVDSAVEVVHNVPICRRARLARKVRTRRRNRCLGQSNQFSCNRIGWHSHADRVEPACRNPWDYVLCGNDHGHRTRPESCHQRLHVVRNHIRQFAQIAFRRYVHNHWIIRGSALCGVDFAYCLWVQRIRSESVHGLRRECHQPAVFDNLGGSTYLFSCRSNDFRFHLYSLSRNSSSSQPGRS